jgi:histidinol-phosphate aminotransferase
VNLVRPQIQGIVEYSLRQYPHRIKLNQNENPYELPAPIKKEILDRLASEAWSRYPPFVPDRQLAALAAFTGWKADGVLLGNGSNDLLQLLFTCVLDGGRSVVLSQPTFTLYTLLAQSLGAKVQDVRMVRTPPSEAIHGGDLLFDVDGLIASANRSGAAMIVVCSPNNPTGTQLSAGEVEKLVDSTAGLVVVDEAYVQFSAVSVAGLLARHPRLVVLQTFSKAMGAAGLRFGYALLDPGLARELNKVKLPYSVNIFTLIAAEVLMARWNELKVWIGLLTRERERVRSVLAGLPGISVLPSTANFLLFESSGKTPAELFAAVLAKGILIRNVSAYPMLQRALRVSIGTPAENDEFLDALRGAL